MKKLFVFQSETISIIDSDKKIYFYDGLNKSNSHLENFISNYKNYNALNIEEISLQRKILRFLKHQLIYLNELYATNVEQYFILFAIIGLFVIFSLLGMLLINNMHNDYKRAQLTEKKKKQ